MGFEPIALVVLLAAGAVAAGVVARHEHSRRQREQARADRLEAELRPARLYRMRARVDYDALLGIHPVELEAIFPELEIDHDPPAAGPEAEIRFTQLATSEEMALRIAARRLERAGLPPLALAAHERQLA